MKIIVTADLHAEFLQQGALDKFARTLTAKKPDVLIMAGDCGVGKAWGRAQCALRNVAPRRYIVAGNHDLYLSDYDYVDRRLHRSPRMKFEKQLPEETQACGWTWAEEMIIRVGDDRRTAIICSVGWYDMELSGPNLDRAKLAKATYHSDSRYIDRYDPAWDDLAFCAERKASIVRRLAECQEDPEIDNVILVTHVPPFAQMRVPLPDDLPELDGCFYGPSVGRAISGSGFGILKQVISGHTHRGMDSQIERAGMDPIHVQVIGADYNRPAWIEVNL